MTETPTTTGPSTSELVGAALASRGTAALIADVGARFAADVAEHQLTVVHDDGLHRHLRFTSPKSSDQWFEVVTWPGTLAYHGDMGTYVFSRVPDMLAFFRAERVNPSYWVQKLQSGEARRYSTDLLRENLHQAVLDWAEALDEDLTPERVEAALEEVSSSILTLAEIESVTRDALTSFEHDGLSFPDSWEWELDEFTHRFLWCCHALVWAVARYDAAEAGADPTGA